MGDCENEFEMNSGAGHRDEPEAAFPVLSYLGLVKGAPALDDQKEDRLLSDLSHEKWAVRIAAVQRLAQLDTPGSRQALIRALEDEHEAVRAAAVRALAKAGAQMPVKPLIVALGDPSWYVRTAAVLVLAKLGKRMPLDPLLAMLTDEDASVRAAAATALGKGLALAGGNILREAGPGYTTVPEHQLSPQNLESLAMQEQAPLTALVAALGDPDDGVREAVVLALAELGEYAPSGPLLAACDDEDAAVREAAELALQKRRADAVAAVEEHTFDPSNSESLPGRDAVQPAGLGEHMFAEKENRPERNNAPVSNKASIRAERVRPISRRRPPARSRGVFGRASRHNPFLKLLEWGTLAAVLTVVVLGAWLFAHWSNPAVGSSSATFVYHNPSGAVAKLAWNGTADSQGSKLAFVGANGLVQVWDTVANRLVWSYDTHLHKILAFRWTPQGLRIISLDAQGKVQVIQLTQRGASAMLQTLLPLIHFPGPVSVARWAPDGTRIALAGTSGMVQVWDIASHSIVSSYNDSAGAITALAWSPNGKDLVSASDDGTVLHTKPILVRAADTGKPVPIIANAKLERHAANFRVVSLAWSPDGSSIAYSMVDGEIHVWNIESSKDNAFTSTNYSYQVSSAGQVANIALAWSPQGTRLASTTGAGLVQVWDATFGNLLYSYSGHAKQVNDLAWSLNGTRLASGCADGTVQVWDAFS
ncbi:hypothetical protein EPA93_37915 [Ktedonosporobacter rubrisoli]|uniref:Uncharacterized protein n=1 Tax=Ktedonosporobacter rubrisoli TaxID=2509675 RepID=A0A4P6K0V2_KTERU|nr:HEAT repeat domain-containing protein [Ktedonosporobacter rubrisoli]QBD81443.1 hypothetical protein EPA93_37915 [Ktedonosporobacter rubrisoli]